MIEPTGPTQRATTPAPVAPASPGATPRISPERNDVQHAPMSAIARAVSPLVKAPLRAGNDVQLFVDGKEAYPRMNALIDGAKTRIDMEFFGFYPDEGGQRMVDRLVAKAKAGVQVNVMVDLVACKSLKNQPLLDQLTAAGVNVTPFTNGYNKHPLLHAFSITDHRKILVVDGQTAMTGGMNLGVSYEKYWHDFMVQVEGPTVGDILAGFEENWKLSQGKPLRAVTPDLAPRGGFTTQVAHTTPKTYEIKAGMIAAFDHAQDRIFINSPYYVDKDIMAALERAARRGVKVTAIVPTIGDSPVIDYMNKMMTNELLAAGVKVFNYDTTNADFPKHDHVTDHFNHGKLATVDGQWTTIGTANVDTRSMNDNQEINLNVDSPAFAKTIEERVFQQDLGTKCQPATVTHFAWYSWPMRSLMKQLRFLLFAF